MRRTAVSLLSLVLLAAPLVAQQPFEGTVTMKFTAAPNPMVISVKGSRTAASMAIVSPVFNGNLRIIIDNQAQTSTVLLPMAQGGLKLSAPLKAKAATTTGTASTAAPKKLGTSQTIAGLPCDDYEMTDSLKSRACLTKALGNFSLPALGGGARGGASPVAGMLGGASLPEWANNLSGLFPLKAWTADGKVLSEVTAVTKGAVSEDLFAIPADYRDGSALLEMMGRGGRGGRGGGD